MTDLRIDDDQGSIQLEPRGLLPSGVLSVHPMILKYSYDLMSKSRHNILEPILEISFSTIASGATTIGSAGRAPNDVFS
jgi:hypothetical protein